MTTRPNHLLSPSGQQRKNVRDGDNINLKLEHRHMPLIVALHRSVIACFSTFQWDGNSAKLPNLPGS